MSDTTSINGLLSQKPSSPAPVEGAKILLTWEQKTGASGNPYIKIRRGKADDPSAEICRILGVSKTDHVDKYGNISFNVEFEPCPAKGGANGGSVQPATAGASGKTNQPHPANSFQQAKAAMESSGGSQIRTFDALDARQRAIIRQHSQSMALEVLKLKVTLNELTVEDLTPAKLRQLADYFDNDVYGQTI